MVLTTLREKKPYLEIWDNTNTSIYFWCMIADPANHIINNLRVRSYSEEEHHQSPLNLALYSSEIKIDDCEDCSQWKTKI